MTCKPPSPSPRPDHAPVSVNPPDIHSRLNNLPRETGIPASDNSGSPRAFAGHSVGRFALRPIGFFPEYCCFRVLDRLDCAYGGKGCGDWHTERSSGPAASWGFPVLPALRDERDRYGSGVRSRPRFVVSQATFFGVHRCEPQEEGRNFRAALGVFMCLSPGFLSSLWLALKSKHNAV